MAQKDVKKYLKWNIERTYPYLSKYLSKKKKCMYVYVNIIFKSKKYKKTY